ncbi:hypothetical protein O3M35_012383 [Rhynocoris fuscipes]|uniref:UDENN domain-containing protein n=1 Tax=Rhynocoris fuscipes TaxID=488301 RepID=A0AAW1CTL8_9HEMI
MEEETKKKTEGPILHVLVVGFHHKRGCQVEYSFPPLIRDASVDGNECPPGWKYLPTLALPDGSHNFDKDTVFFHLPGLNSPDETVFGISCFRQIPVEKLKNRTADITRGTVQKAVCVLSTIPLYGHIQVKMELITHAYFDEGDFTKVSLLEDTYHHLNNCLNQIEDLHTAPQLFVGLSARDLVLALKHKALLLYKLLLLEKKVLFFQSPVQPLCSAILTLISFHPGMIDKGLYQSACIRPSRPMSPVPQFTDTNKLDPSKIVIKKGKEMSDEQKEIIESKVEIKINEAKEATEENLIKENEFNEKKINGLNGHKIDADVKENEKENMIKDLDNEEKEENEKLTNGDIGSLSRDTSMDIIGDTNIQNTMATIAQIEAETCGLPLQLFSNGYLCLPYLSLPYMDVLTDKNIRGYVLGATNVLFKQKKNLADVVVELETGLIETLDLDLKRMLHLSTEDLRFGEFLVRHVSTGTRHDVYTDGVGWEGGDDWIRAQFHAYTLCLLRTSLLQEGSKEIDQFNKWYIAALQESESYKQWLSNPLSMNVLEINPGHPFTGQLSVSDMKLRLAHTMQTTEGGRKLNQAMVSTGRVVATTGRAVGGAISQAKGALSNWWSNLTTAPPAGSATVADPSIEQLPTSNNAERQDEIVNQPPVEQALDALEQHHPILQV